MKVDKALALRGLDEVSRACGAMTGARLRACCGLTVLMYHKILPDKIAVDYPLRNLVVSESLFARQMDWVASNYEVCVVSNGADVLSRKANGRPRLAISFDDGYLDNAEFAAPILEHRGLRATFFVTSGFVEGTPLWFDVAASAFTQGGAPQVRDVLEGSPHAELCDEIPSELDGWMGLLKRLPAERRESIVRLLDSSPMREQSIIFGAMSREQIGALHRAGHEIGSHTQSHPILIGLDDHRLEAELTGSRQALERWVGEPVRSFCYPNGDFDERVIAAVRGAEYNTACTTQRGMNHRRSDRLLLRRRFITDENSSNRLAFTSEVLGIRDTFRRLMSAA